ncbi:MAG: dihydrofolate reductase family protein, partial [Brevundimonas sp.]|nr:dihydrofolate reductase family protein [Brevundimonas sp.]
APTPIGSATIEQVDARDGRPTPAAALAAIRRKGGASVLIEGGGQVAASFLRAGLVDRLEWFRAPILLGSEGRPCVAALSLAKLADAPKFRRKAVQVVGDDLWERLERI